MEETRIGDFSKPLVEKPAAAGATGDTKVRLEAAEQNLEAEANTAEAALKPLKSYEERLKEAGVTKEQAAEIIDAVIMKGHWSEPIKITERIKLRLRTRSARDIRRIQDHLEVQRPIYDAHYTEIMGRMSLAASLESLGADKFTFPGKDAKSEEYEAAFQARVNYIENLADPTLRLLFLKLWTFDEKIRVVLSEGVIENF
jgi:hypothetical protein